VPDNSKPGPGRPRLGENRLEALAKHASEAVGLRLLKASERFNIDQLAQALGCDKKTLYDYAYSTKPRISTIEKLCRALGRRPIEARAIMRRLSAKDCAVVETAIKVDCGCLQLRSLFTDPKRVREQINGGLAKLRGPARVLTLSDYLLARAGLKYKDSESLPPELAALNAHLKPINGGFDRYVRPVTMKRQRDGYALLTAGLLELAYGHEGTRVLDALVAQRVAVFKQTVTLTNPEPGDKGNLDAKFEAVFDFADRIDEILTFIRRDQKGARCERLP